MRLVLIGPPGAGKGTQCKRLADKYELTHLSSGDIFRGQMAAKTELGNTAKKYIDEGQLVPDPIVISMMTDAVKNEQNCILDGFPRTVNQAKALDEALEKLNCDLDAVVELIVADEEVASRLTKRRVCLNCGATYHLEYSKPKVDGICDSCGRELIQRDDDTEEVIFSRLATYHKQTEPIIDYYKNSGKKLISIDAAGSIDEITKELTSAIDNI
ncbi:MAG: adenylate kinase [Sedimentisphaeraceae bacterium JB056]